MWLCGQWYLAGTCEPGETDTELKCWGNLKPISVLQQMVWSWIMSTLGTLCLLFKLFYIYFLQVLNAASAYDKSKQIKLVFCVCVCACVRERERETVWYLRSCGDPLCNCGVMSLTRHCKHLILIGMFCCCACSDSWGSSWGPGEPYYCFFDSPLWAPDPYWYVLLFSFCTHLMNVM